jgi:hypothetical protein
MRRVAELMRVFPGTVVDRRRCQDRRADWRGGRRDEDWTARPHDVPAPAENGHQARGWSRWFSARVNR